MVAYLTQGPSAMGALGVKKHLAIFVGLIAAAIIRSQTVSFQRRLYKDGDIIIGAIIPVSSNRSCCLQTSVCDDLLPESVLWVEAMIYTIKIINEDPDILPNITLGYDIKDYCRSTDIAIKHALEFVDVIEASAKQENGGCKFTDFKSDSVSRSFGSIDTLVDNGVMKNFDDFGDNIGLLAGTSSQIKPVGSMANVSLPFTNVSSEPNTTGQCGEKPVSVIIGCMSSGVTAAVASVVQVSRIPVIGFESTSVSLGDKTRYPTFSRTVLSDNVQARVMLDVFRAYNWTYISIVGTKGEYGRQGMETLLNEISLEGSVCVAVKEFLDPQASRVQGDIERVVDAIKDNPKARVVVLFMEREHAKRLLREAHRRTLTGYIWVATEAWANYPDIENFERSLVEGTVGIAHKKGGLQGFHQHLFNLDVICSNDHPWLYELICNRGACDPEVIRYHRECCLGYFARNKKMACPLPPSIEPAEVLKDTIRFADTDNILNAIYTAAYGLDSVIRNSQNSDEGGLVQNDFVTRSDTEVNTNSSQPILGTRSASPQNAFRFSDLVDQVRKVDFIGKSGRRVRFTDEGDLAEGQYEIVNLQYNDCFDKLEWVTVGLAKNNGDKTSIKLHKDLIKFAKGTTSTFSRCSPPCKAGWKVLLSPQECCWECQRCPLGTVSNTSMATECVPCGRNKHTAANNTECRDDFVRYLFLTDPVGIVILIFSVFGQVITLMVISILGRHKNNPICSALAFKTTSLLVCYAGFLQPIIYTVQPSDILCIFQKMTWFSVYIVHGATLVARTYKVKFYVDKLKRKLGYKLHNVHHAVMWMFAIVGFVLLGVSFLNNVPFVRYKKDSQTDTVAFAICVERMAVEDIVAVVYPCLLLVVTGLLAETSKHSCSLDDKFLSYTSGAVLLMLVVFLPIYYSIEDGIGRVIILAVSAIITQYAILFLTYFTKIYYMFRSYHKKESVRNALAIQRQNMASLNQPNSQNTNGSVVIETTPNNER